MLWWLRNGSLDDLTGVRAHVLNIQSFSAELGQFRPHAKVQASWSIASELKSGNEIKAGILVAFLEGDQLQIGRTRNELLPWPNADRSVDRRWLVKINVRWHTGEWPVDLDIRWAVGSKQIEVESYFGVPVRFLIATHDSQVSPAELARQREKLGRFSQGLLGALGSNYSDLTFATQALLSQVWQRMLADADLNQTTIMKQRIALSLALLREVESALASARAAVNEERILRLSELEEECKQLPKSLFAVGPITADDAESKPTADSREVLECEGTELSDFLSKVAVDDPNYRGWIAHNARIREIDHRSRARAIRDGLGGRRDPQILADNIESQFDTSASSALATVVDAQSAAAYCSDMEAHVADCSRLVEESKVWERTGFIGDKESFLKSLKGRLSARLEDAKADAWSIVHQTAKTDPGVGEAARSDDPNRGDHSGRLFRKEGESWRLVFDGKEVHVNDRKGFGYIEALLRVPGRSIFCLEFLVGHHSEEKIPTLGSAGEVLDGRARSEYSSRVRELDEQIAEAERNHDRGNKERLQCELDQILEQLTSAFGLGGHSRKAHDDREKIRKSVSNAIGRALAVIQQHHPAMADHLNRSIKLGSFISYQPDSTTWEF